MSTPATAQLLEPMSLAGLRLSNRLWMAPMTRARADAGDVPSHLAPSYYAQRSSAGLIITEGSPVSPQGVGFVRTPGIYSEEQIRGWSAVTDAVHERDGTIFLQLWHVGRLSHPSFHDGGLPVAPSALDPHANVFTESGRMPAPVPRALSTAEVRETVEQHRQAARNARRAGFDGVEIHGGHDFLPMQFLHDGSNTRTDEYGGSIERRARFLFEVLEACAEEGLTGVRLSSPANKEVGIPISDPIGTYEYVYEKLNTLDLAYLHLVEGLPGSYEYCHAVGETPYVERARRAFRGTIVLNGGYDPASAYERIEAGLTDAVAFARLYISNPDLPHRVKCGHPLAEPDPATFYQGEEVGYVDYAPACSHEHCH